MSVAGAPVRADLPPPTRMLGGSSVYRIVWQLHTDVLVGYCWCGESHEDVDPVAMWEWLLAHPGSHGTEVGEPAGRGAGGAS